MPGLANSHGDVLERMTSAGAEQVMFAADRASGLRLVVVIHDTTLGPSLGGVRMHPYPSEGAALADGLRLSRAMTLKAAAAGLDLGGSTALVLADPAADKNERLLRAVGRFLGTMRSRFIAVNDVGTTSADMQVLQRAGARACLRDPSPYTAQGVIESMRAVRSHAGHSASLSGVHVAVQGVGNVGRAVVAQLEADGARITVADLVSERAAAAAERHGAAVVDPAALPGVECDVLCPCAMGSVVTAETFGRLRCQAIVGGANNIVESPDLEQRLVSSGIDYVPDFVASAGGLIALEEELLGHDDDSARRRVRSVRDTVQAVLAESVRNAERPAATAERMAAERLAATTTSSGAGR
jgi:glutamate dehydrogenase/leucine dehydrogenase